MAVYLNVSISQSGRGHLPSCSRAVRAPYVLLRHTRAADRERSFADGGKANATVAAFCGEIRRFAIERFKAVNPRELEFPLLRVVLSMVGFFVWIGFGYPGKNQGSTSSTGWRASAQRVEQTGSL